MWLNNTLRMLAVASLILLLAACGGGSGESANYAAIPSESASSIDLAATRSGDTTSLAPSEAAEPSTVTVTSSSDTAPTASLPAEVLESVTSSYDQFLVIRSSVIVAQRELDALGGLASDQAAAQVGALRKVNDGHVEDEAIVAMTDLMEWSNISGAVQQGDQIMFVDCTERQYITRLGARRIAFATNDVVMTKTDSGFAVESVVERQNGAYATTVGERGCVPASFGERADRTVTTAITDLASMYASPAQAKVSEIFAQDLRFGLQDDLDRLASDQMLRIADETFELSIVGMDLGKPEFTVIVSMCTHYPTGYSYTDEVSGIEMAPEILPGTSQLALVYVQLDPGVGADTGDVITAIEPQTATCPGV